MHTLFGAKHLILIGISLAAIVMVSLAVRKVPLEKLFRPLFLIGLVSEFIKVFYYILANEAAYGGILPKSDLPFHLCSVQILFFALLSYSSNDRLKNTLMDFMLPSCLLGGLAAIFIATASSLNGKPILSLQYFGYHCALVVFGLVLMTNSQRKLTIKNYVTCLQFLIGLFLVAIYLNSILFDGQSNINFMYVVSPPQSGLPFLTEEHGWLVYICHYAFLVVVCVTLCYIRPIWASLRTAVSKKPVQV